MLDEDRLQLLEYVRSPADHHENVLVFDEYETVATFVRDVAQRARGRTHLALVDLEPVMQRLARDQIREAAYTYKAELMDTNDIVLYLLNPNTVAATFTSFFVDASSTVLRFWQDDDGLDYLHLEKSRVGTPGRGSIVEYIEAPPYVRLV